MMMVFFFFTVIVMLNVLIGKSLRVSVVIALVPFLEAYSLLCLGPSLTLHSSVFVFFILCVALINNAITDGDQSWQLDWMEYRMRYIESAENMTYDIPGKETHSPIQKKKKMKISCRNQKQNDPLIQNAFYYLRQTYFRFP
jgi:hypothetical protein